METINQSAAIALYERRLVTSILAAHPPTFGVHTETDDTPDLVSFGSLLVEQSDSEAMVTRQLSPWDLLKESQAVHQASLDIRTSGVPVISVFATGAWRLLIASMTIELPRLLAGESFVSGEKETMIVLTAKLYAPRPKNKATSSHALSVWRAVVPQADDEEMSSFLFTALRLASRAMSGNSKAFR